MSEKKYNLRVTSQNLAALEALRHSVSGRPFPSLREARAVSAAVKLLYPGVAVEIVSQIERTKSEVKTLRG